MTITINFSGSPHAGKPAPKKTPVGHTVPNPAKIALILDALLSGQRLTDRIAAYKWDVYCLGGLIFYLRHRHGVPVKTQLMKSTSPAGYVTRYAEYFLTATDIAEINAKKFPQ